MSDEFTPGGPGLFSLRTGCLRWAVKENRNLLGCVSECVVVVEILGNRMFEAKRTANTEVESFKGADRLRKSKKLIGGRVKRAGDLGKPCWPSLPGGRMCAPAPHLISSHRTLLA